jgi:copper chaperone CopZ
MTTLTCSIPGINCGHCVRTIETELSELEGVTKVRADAQTKTAVISFEPPATEVRIKKLLAEINFPVAG